MARVTGPEETVYKRFRKTREKSPYLFEPAAEIRINLLSAANGLEYYDTVEGSARYTGARTNNEKRLFVFRKRFRTELIHVFDFWGFLTMVI